MTDTVPDVPAAAPETRSGFDLDDFEVRVLAVLIEQSFVTPDTCPLSVNALVTGCNQLTGREPVMSLSEATVLATLDRLVERGLVTQRQRPATAKGTIFVTLEDEHGMVNVIVWPHLATRRRLALLQSRLLAVRGRWERVDGVCHLVAGDLHDLSDLLGSLQVDSRDFH